MQAQPDMIGVAIRQMNNAALQRRMRRKMKSRIILIGVPQPEDHEDSYHHLLVRGPAPLKITDALWWFQPYLALKSQRKVSTPSWHYATWYKNLTCIRGPK